MKEILAQFARQAGVTIDILEQTDSTNNRAAESRYGAGDVVIAVSHTGRSRSVVNAAKIAYEQGATVIGITAALKSPLQRYCTYVLYVGTKDTTDTKDIVSRRIGEYLVLETLYLYYNINIDSKVQDHRRKSADVIYSLKMDDSDESTGNPKLESG